MADGVDEAAALYALMKEALAVFAGQPLSLELTERMTNKLTAYALVSDQLLERPESNPEGTT
jgi:hypothetical protein